MYRFTVREIAKTCKVDLIEIVTAVIGIAWAFNFARRLMNSVLERIHEVVTHVGHTFDALHAEQIAHTLIFVDGPYAVAKY